MTEASYESSILYLSQRSAKVRVDGKKVAINHLYIYVIFIYVLSCASHFLIHYFLLFTQSCISIS